MARQIVIGDIHACYDELQALLDRIGPGVDDEIIAVGDLMNRGPAGERVLTFFRDTPQARSIRGNHEETHLRAALGECPLRIADLITRAELGADYETWLQFIAKLPVSIELESAYVAHGLFEPGVSFTQQREDVLLGYVTGEDYLLEQVGDAWYELYDGDKPLIVGHHHYRRDGQPLIIDERVYAIDTGCTHGGRLTAVILPEFEIISVPSRRNYWVEISAAAEAVTENPLDRGGAR